MSRILVDRDLLQRVLDVYFDLESENRAYFGIWQSMQLYGPSEIQAGLQKYHAQVQVEKAKELSGTEGVRSALREKVRAEDDASFLPKLISRFAPR
jgi:hypothetical protein